jgi:hypothetical protein
MIIKATTTNPATRFCTMAVTPGELMNKATGSNRGINAGAALHLEPTMGLGLNDQREVAQPKRAQPST